MVTASCAVPLANQTDEEGRAVLDLVEERRQQVAVCCALVTSAQTEVDWRKEDTPRITQRCQEWKNFLVQNFVLGLKEDLT